MASRASFDGRNFRSLAYRIDRIPQQFHEQGQTVVEDVTSEAEADMRQFIELAVTPTGERRVEQGRRSAGRIETEAMIGDVSSEVTDTENKITGSWGWLDGIEDYYKYQENGTEHIEAMHALLNSFLQARENLRGRMKEVMSI